MNNVQRIVSAPCRAVPLSKSTHWIPGRLMSTVAHLLTPSHIATVYSRLHMRELLSFTAHLSTKGI